MQTLRPAWLMIGAAFMLLGAPHSDARRLGAKSAASAGSAIAKAEPKSGGGNAGSVGNVGLGMALRQGAAATVGGAAGGAAAKALMDSDREPAERPAPEAERLAAAEQRRQDKLTDLERKARAEELAAKSEQLVKDAELRRKTDLAAKQADEKRRQDEADAKRAEAEQQRAEQKRQAIAREMSCVIKPTMTDDEIDHCKQVWSAPPP